MVRDLQSLYEQTGAFPPQLQNSIGSIIGADPFTLICANQDRYICVDLFSQSYPLSDFAGASNCRGVVLPIDPTDCEVILTCADEVPREDCSAVDVTIGYQVIVRDPEDPTCAVVINDTHTFSCFGFVSVSEPNFGSFVPASEALRIADGSCVQVWLDCDVSDDGTELIVRGFIIDKLWKKENLLILAPAFRLNDTVTVESEFLQAPGPCENGAGTPMADLDLNA
ncbi:hypothetical protein E2C16_03480 [Sporosarcina pasteurii]|uniref:Uncharacterized protein n=2 Tax=Sporosarcina pasteurii TaxID=1474 RepID=A0A380C3V4_SPOPA|nr:hypothetical protein [Sporosarcina pasteurii]QBQ04789.1 hypothetical protein E2C16_03480 [Sporosarcina pasteurii]SUJ11250.1 Uncharacterised protein [Sporosarcina pasteurii]